MSNETKLREDRIIDCPICETAWNISAFTQCDCGAQIIFAEPGDDLPQRDILLEAANTLDEVGLEQHSLFELAARVLSIQPKEEGVPVDPVEARLNIPQGMDDWCEAHQEYYKDECQYCEKGVETKEIPDKEWGRMMDDAKIDVFYRRDMTEFGKIIFIEGYINGAKAEYLRHLSPSSKAEIGLRWVKANERLPLHMAHWISNKFGVHDNDFPVRMKGRYSMGNIYDQRKITESAPRYMLRFDGKDHYEDEFSEIEWGEELESIPSSEPATSIYSDILVQHWKGEIKTANEKIDEYRLSDPAQLQWWFGYKDAINNAINKYCSVLSPAEPAKESQQPIQRAEFEKLVWKLWKEDGSPQVNMHAYLHGAIAMNRYHRQRTSSHPEPSEQSQPSFTIRDLEEAFTAGYWNAKDATNPDNPDMRQYIRSKGLSPSPPSEEKVLVPGKDFLCEDMGDPECTKQCWSCKQTQQTGRSIVPSPPSVKPEREDAKRGSVDEDTRYYSEADLEEGKRIMSLHKGPPPSPTEQEGCMPSEIGDWIDDAVAKDDKLRTSDIAGYVKGAIAMYRKMQEEIKTLRESYDSTVDHAHTWAKKAEDLQSQLLDKQVEAGKYRDALERIQNANPETSWAFQIAEEILLKYPTPKPTNHE